MIFTDLTSPPLIMGILNVTPDSFSDGGKYTEIESALSQAENMISDGASIIDIGGESTRPGSQAISPLEQINRVIPVIRAIRQELSKTIPISIDTTLSNVAKAALDAGASLINDISAGIQDKMMLSLTSERNVPIILMHMQGQPQTMQAAPCYEEVVSEVIQHLKNRIDAALSAGVTRQNIAIDPGIGFGKRKQDNLQLLAHLDQFVALGYPVLLGTSRKRFMGSICDEMNPENLISATTATTALGVAQGVLMFRVHDVKENKQAADVAWAIKESSLKYLNK